MHALLPFFVNGSLDAEQRLRVELWLSRSPTHAEELSWLSRLAQTVRSQADEARSDAGLGHLRSLIEADARNAKAPGAVVGPTITHAGVRSRPAASSNSVGRWLGWFKELLTPQLALAYGIVAVQAAALVFITAPPPCRRGTSAFDRRFLGHAGRPVRPGDLCAVGQRG